MARNGFTPFYICCLHFIFYGVAEKHLIESMLAADHCSFDLTVGTALGIVAWQQSQPAPDLLEAHIVIGALLFAFAMLQAGSALVASIRKNTKLR